MSRKHSAPTLESPHQSSNGLGQHPDESLRQPLESILTTGELRRRPSRPPDYQAENHVLTSLMHEMAGSPRNILRLLAESALKLCRAHSSGISLLEEENGRKIFRWHAAAGQWSRYLGGTMPREASPCGTVLDRNASLLFSHPERHFPIPPDVTPAPVEVLLIPFHFADEPIGTIWVIAHDDSRQFDAEDERIMTSLGRFASTAYQALASFDALKSQAEARKKAEAERDRLHSQQQRNHQLLQRLVERSPVAIAIVRGTELQFTLANPAYLAITGSSDPIIGRALLDVLPEARETGADQRLLNVIRTGQPYSLQNTKFVRNQIETWWDGEVLPLKNEAGVVDSALILAWDITARKRAEDAVHATEQHFRRILDALPAAIYTTDPEGRVTHFNSAAVEMSGRVPELLTDNWCVSWKLYHPDGTPMPHGECPMAIALKQGRAIRGAEALLERPDGTRVPFLAYPTPLRDADGKIVGGINMLVDITERKEAEAATAFLAAIINHSDDAIVSKDLNGVITSWNKGAERLFGYTAQEAIGHPVTMLIPPDRLPEETEILSRLRRGQPMDHFETVRIRKDRSLIEISLTVSPIKDSKGRIIGASKIARDITERKRSEAALRESEERFRTLFTSAPVAVFVCDRNAVIQHYNQRAVELWGRAPVCGVEQHCGSVKLWLPDNTLLPHTQSPMVQVLRTGVPALNVEVFIERPDGSRLPVLVNFAALKNGEGEINGAITSFIDITERKQAEQLLSLRAAQHQALFEFAGCANRARKVEEIYEAAMDAILAGFPCDRSAILFADPAGVMRFTAWRSLSEEYRAAVEGHSPWRLDDPDPQPISIPDVAKAEIDAAIRRALQAEKIAAVAFIPIRDHERLVGKFMVYCSEPRQFKTEELHLCQTIATTLTWAIERKRGEERLERLVHERTAELEETIVDLEAFSYSVAHDMRAPLRAMQGFARILVEEHSRHLDQTATGYLDRIIQSSHRLDRLIQDVLSYTKILQADFPLEPVDLDRLVRDIIGSYPDFHSSRSTVHVPEVLPTVLGNQAWLTQCLSNLLSNAVKFVPPGIPPVVKVFAETLNGHVRVWVEDNGIGIAPRDKDRIFRLFERVHTASEYSGTGIGLTIARKAIERMGGHIGVESELGQGSRFWIELKKA